MRNLEIDFCALKQDKCLHGPEMKYTWKIGSKAERVSCWPPGLLLSNRVIQESSVQHSWTESAFQWGADLSQAHCLTPVAGVHLYCRKQGAGWGILQLLPGWSLHVAVELRKLKDTISASGPRTESSWLSVLQKLGGSKFKDLTGRGGKKRRKKRREKEQKRKWKEREKRRRGITENSLWR